MIYETVLCLAHCGLSQCIARMGIVIRQVGYPEVSVVQPEVFAWVTSFVWSIVGESPNAQGASLDQFSCILNRIQSMEGNRRHIGIPYTTYSSTALYSNIQSSLKCRAGAEKAFASKYFSLSICGSHCSRGVVLECRFGYKPMWHQAIDDVAEVCLGRVSLH